MGRTALLILLAIASAQRAPAVQHKVAGACPTQSGDDSSDFPEDLFSLEQRRHGAIILHLICGLYCFIIIAFVCNDYFLPSVDCICQDLNLSKDVAGATFMAFATSAPELFVNIIGTFLTQSDLGVGTVVGSAVCNTVGVPACGGLAALAAIKLEVWPLVRDCSIYFLVVAILTVILWDKKVYWYEALILLFLYVLYLIILFCQRRLHRAAKTMVRVSTKGRLFTVSEKVDKKWEKQAEAGSYRVFQGVQKDSAALESGKMPVSPPTPPPTPDEDPVKLWQLPDGGYFSKFWYLMSWPVAFCLYITVPDPKKRRSLYPLTFIFCIFWIGCASYIVSWMMTLLGQTFGISDSVMGLTLVAIGGSMPEASSTVINARMGIGSMSISNALGGNTLDILLSLGLPWFIKTQLSGPVVIQSVGVVYNNAAQLACVAALFIALAANSFKLDRRLGIVCLILYLLFIFFIVALEVDLFHIKPSAPVCS